jgi:hypothetical protein
LQLLTLTTESVWEKLQKKKASELIANLLAVLTFSKLLGIIFRAANTATSYVKKEKESTPFKMVDLNSYQYFSIEVSSSKGHLISN